MHVGVCCMGSSMINRSVGSADKVKFTVTVRGHQLSSARHIHETLQEFSKVIEANSRRLGFIGGRDMVERLQLARADGSEPEELDVDSTLEDVLICMGDKTLVAIINNVNNNSCDAAKFGSDGHDSEEIRNSPGVDFTGTQILKKNEVHLNKLDDAQVMKTNDTQLCREDNIVSPTCTQHGSLNFINFVKCAPHTVSSFQKKGAFQHSLQKKDLRIAIPNDDDDRLSPIHSDLPCVCLKKEPPAVCPRVVANATPSPAELAQYLVHNIPVVPQRVDDGLSVNPGLPVFHDVHEVQEHGFQSLAPTGLSGCINKPTPINHSFKIPAPNIAMLAQFLACQLRAFVPMENINQVTSNLSAKDERLHTHTSVSNAQQTPHTVLEKGKIGEMNQALMENQSQTEDQDPGSSAIESRVDKDQSSSSAINAHHQQDTTSLNINVAANEDLNSRPEMVFLVNRRSKTGAGTHRLKMSELSSYFHLSVVDAAKRLGVSQTTLKKACRKFGLKRWPGRKVRSLESTIHGLEHTIALGQGAGMEELTEAQIRSEVLKLQQEMDQLVHGIPPVQSPALRTTDLYKRLYSKGWRSRYHRKLTSNHLDIDTGQAAKNVNDSDYRENITIGNSMQSSAGLGQNCMEKCGEDRCKLQLGGGKSNELLGSDQGGDEGSCQQAINKIANNKRRTRSSSNDEEAEAKADYDLQGVTEKHLTETNGIVDTNTHLDRQGCINSSSNLGHHHHCHQDQAMEAMESDKHPTMSPRVRPNIGSEKKSRTTI